MKLGTHKERMIALEDAFDRSDSGMEKAAIVEAASRMDRENEFAERDYQRSSFAGIPQRQGN
jgi:hypothetical protein